MFVFFFLFPLLGQLERQQEKKNIMKSFTRRRKSSRNHVSRGKKRRLQTHRNRGGTGNKRTRSPDLHVKTFVGPTQDIFGFDPIEEGDIVIYAANNGHPCKFQRNKDDALSRNHKYVVSVNGKKPNESDII